MYNSVICSPFVEHPIVDIAQFDASAYDVTIFEEDQASNFLIKGQFNKEQYCKCLLHKLFTLNKSKIKPFIHYQCSKLNDPIVWLNKLEKLIDLNREFFTTKDQIIKFEKALIIIEVMRDAIEQKKITTTSFNFNELKNKLKEYNDFDDKLSFLMEARTVYLQNKPKIIDVNEIPFDEKINLELELIKSQQKLSKKRNTIYSQEVNSPKSPTKNTKSPTEICRTSVGLFQFNCQTNIFVDVFFQLTKEMSIDGKPLLNMGSNDLAQFITNNFIDKNGNALSLNTVKTILNVSRPEKRPSSEKRIKLKVKDLPK
jgi:hypothetical protein